MTFKSIGRNVLIAATVTGALLFATVEASLAATLRQLINTNGTLQVGELLFSNFSANLTNVGDNATPDRLRDVNVDTLNQPGFLPGLRIQGGLFAGNNSSLDLTVSFIVRSLNLSAPIDSVRLSFNGVATDERTGQQTRDGDVAFAKVTETIERLSNSQTIGNLSVTTLDPVDSLSDVVRFRRNPAEALFITKNIFLRGGEDGIATISIVDQRYSQIPTPMLLPGMIGFGLAALRKRKAEAADDSEA
jgi:hypothetical protein